MDKVFFQSGGKMTEDNLDWSLKGKRFMVDDGYALLSTEEIDDTERGLYDSDDIDTLREKLIEDIEELFKDYSWEQNFSKEIINIINRRFGVQ